MTDSGDLLKRDVTLVYTETGVVVAGDRPDVASFVKRLRSSIPHDEAAVAGRLADSAAAASALAAISASSGEYVQLTQRSLNLLAANSTIPGATPGSVYGVVRDSHGAFAGQLEFQSVSLAASQAAAIQLAAATIALKVAIAKVERSVERVEGKVETLSARLTAKTLGEVVGRHGVLVEMSDNLDDSGYLSRTDWETVASLGAQLPSTIEELRQFCRLRLDPLLSEKDAGKRADKLAELLKKGELRQSLDLLLVAEDSYFRWQRLRLARAIEVDEARVQTMADRATKQLAQNLATDADLAKALGACFEQVASANPFDALHPLKHRRIVKETSALHELVKDFGEARGLQVDSWAAPGRPALKDAAREAQRLLESTAKLALETGHELANAVGEQTSRAWESSREQASGWGDAASEAIQRGADKAQESARSFREGHAEDPSQRSK